MNNFQTDLFDQEQVLPLWVRVDLGVMAMKSYSTLPESPEVESRYQMQFSVTPKTGLFLGGGILLFCR